MASRCLKVVGTGKYLTLKDRKVARDARILRQSVKRRERPREQIVIDHYGAKMLLISVRAGMKGRLSSSRRIWVRRRVYQLPKNIRSSVEKRDITGGFSCNKLLREAKLSSSEGMRAKAQGREQKAEAWEIL